MNISRLFSIWICASAMCLAQDPVELVVKSFDISALTNSVTDASLERPNWELPIMGAYIAFGEDAKNDREPRTLISSDRLVEILRDAAGQEAWDTDGTFLRLSSESTRLTLRQSPAIVKKITNYLAALSAQVNQNVELEILVVKGNLSTLAGLTGDKGRVSAQRFAAIASGADQGIQVLASSSCRAVAGKRSLMEKTRRVSFVGETDVEVAQSSLVGDPNVLTLKDGSSVLVRPLLLADGRICLRVQAQLTSGLVLRTFNTETSTGALQLPQLDLSKVITSGVVKDGEALVIGSVGVHDKNPRFLLVRASMTQVSGAVLQGTKNTSRAYRIDYLTQAKIRTQKLNLGKANTGLHREFLAEDFEPIPFISGDELIDLIRESVTPKFWETTFYRLDLDQQVIWLTAGPEQHRGVVNLIASMESMRAQDYAMEAHIVRISRKHLSSIQMNSKRDWAQHVLRSSDHIREHSFVACGESGANVEWVHGSEFSYVADYDAEIAQASSISDPKVSTGFAGVRVKLSPRSMDKDSFMLNFDADYSALVAGSVAKISSFKTQGSGSGVIERPDLNLGRCQGETPLNRGQFTCLGELAGDGEAVRLLIVRLQ